MVVVPQPQPVEQPPRRPAPGTQTSSHLIWYSTCGFFFVSGTRQQIG